MNKRKNSGITLIAMVITIIVMLILAGVSINAAIGDNGIITQAQEATIRQSEATLTEYLQQVYVDEETEDRVNGADLDTPLLKLKNVHRDWFYDPRLDDTALGGFDFIFYFDEGTNQFYNLYFIKKSGLPDNIKKNIRGGDSTDSLGNSENYVTYSALLDCYIVSDDLQVNYCDGKLTSFKNVDDEGGLRTMYDSGSSMAKLLTGNNSSSINAQDALAYTELTVTPQDGITSFKDIYFLHNLKKLTLTDYVGDLKGIGNAKKLEYLYINNTNGTTNIDYSGIEGATKLTQLYFYKPTDTEVDKLFTAMGASNYPNLATIGLYGYMASYERTTCWFTWNDSARSELTTLSSMAKLSNTTKNAVITLFIQNNKLTSLNGIQGFDSLKYMSAQCNKLSDISAISTLKSIENVKLYYNNTIAKDKNPVELTDLSPLANVLTLKQVQVEYTPGITDISPIIKNSKTNRNDANETGKVIDVLYANGNTNLVFSGDTWSADNLKALGAVKDLKLDSKYALITASSQGSLTISKDESADNIMTALAGEDGNQVNTAVTSFIIKNNKELSDEQIQHLLKDCLPNVININLDNTNVKSLDFANYHTNIQRISFCGCPDITDITPLCKSIKTGTNSKLPDYKGLGIGMVRFNGNSVVLYKDGDDEFNNQIVSLIHACYDSSKNEGGSANPKVIGMSNGEGGGFAPIGPEYMLQIGKLTNLNRFFSRYYSMPNYADKTINAYNKGADKIPWKDEYLKCFDFSGTSLKNIQLNWNNVALQVKVPSTIETISSYSCREFLADSITNLRTTSGSGVTMICNNIGTVYSTVKPTQNYTTVSFAGDSCRDMERYRGHLGSWVGSFSWSASNGTGSNAYGTFDSSIFTDCTNCNAITIRCKNTTRFDCSDFSGFTRDFSLSLIKCQINNDTIKNFYSAPHITSLILDDNNLSTIGFLLEEPDKLSDCKLTKISLQNNSLSNYVTYRDSSGNPKTQFTATLLAQIPTLKEVWLAGNKDLTNVSGLLNAGFVETTDKNGVVYYKK